MICSYTDLASVTGHIVDAIRIRTSKFRIIVDKLELGVAVRMIRLFQNLSICLQTVTQLPLQIADYRIAHRMAVHGQLTGYHTQAIADPM